MAQHLLFAAMTGNLFHSHLSPLTSDPSCDCSHRVRGQEKLGNGGCGGQPQAHRSGEKGEGGNLEGAENI